MKKLNWFETFISNYLPTVKRRALQLTWKVNQNIFEHLSVSQWNYNQYSDLASWCISKISKNFLIAFITCWMLTSVVKPKLKIIRTLQIFISMWISWKWFAVKIFANVSDWDFAGSLFKNDNKLAMSSIHERVYFYNTHRGHWFLSFR